MGKRSFRNMVRRRMRSNKHSPGIRNLPMGLSIFRLQQVVFWAVPMSTCSHLPVRIATSPWLGIDFNYLEQCNDASEIREKHPLGKASGLFLSHFLFWNHETYGTFNKFQHTFWISSFRLPTQCKSIIPSVLFNEEYRSSTSFDFRKKPLKIYLAKKKGWSPQPSFFAGKLAVSFRDYGNKTTATKDKDISRICHGNPLPFPDSPPEFLPALIYHALDAATPGILFLLLFLQLSQDLPHGGWFQGVTRGINITYNL